MLISQSNYFASILAKPRFDVTIVIARLYQTLAHASLVGLGVPIGTPRMSRALDIDLGRNKAAAITVFDATVTVTSQFAVHLG
jgi:hypothetical protein